MQQRFLQLIPFTAPTEVFLPVPVTAQLSSITQKNPQNLPQ